MSSGQADSSDPSTLPQRPVVQHLGWSEVAVPAGRSGSRAAGGPCPHHRMSLRPEVRQVAIEHQLSVRWRKRSSGHSGGNANDPPDRVRFHVASATFRQVRGGFHEAVTFQSSVRAAVADLSVSGVNRRRANAL